MNAEELKAVLWRLKAVFDACHPHMDWAHARTFDEMLGKLEQHRLDMEAAERTPTYGQVRDAELGGQLGNVVLKTPDELAAEWLRTQQVRMGKAIGRFSAIEKRLGDIESKADDVRAAYIAHMEVLHNEESALGAG